MHLYYQGWIDSLLYEQADQDVEANQGQRPTITRRLPKEHFNGEDWVPFDIEELHRTLDDLDDGGIAYCKVSKPDAYGERHIEVAGTEGWQGLPDDFKVRWEVES